MDEAEQRQIVRDSLLVMADLRLDGELAEHRIKVRNLSAGGMMGEGPVKVVRGALIWINVRNIGWIEGSVAWVQDARFGIAFAEASQWRDRTIGNGPNLFRNHFRICQAFGQNLGLSVVTVTKLRAEYLLLLTL